MDHTKTNSGRTGPFHNECFNEAYAVRSMRHNFNNMYLSVQQLSMNNYSRFRLCMAHMHFNRLLQPQPAALVHQPHPHSPLLLNLHLLYLQTSSKYSRPTESISQSPFTPASRACRHCLTRSCLQAPNFPFLLP